MMMLGGVPIRVTRPPRMVAKESGIRVSAAGRFAFFAAWMSTGIKSANAPTLFMTAESAPARPDITRNVRGQALRRAHDRAGQDVDGAGVRQPLADDQHQGDDHGGGMAEAEEGLVDRHHADDDRGQERGEGHQVVAPAPPDQKDHDDGQDGEDGCLVGGHGQGRGHLDLAGRVPRQLIPERNERDSLRSGGRRFHETDSLMKPRTSCDLSIGCPLGPDRGS